MKIRPPIVGVGVAVGSSDIQEVVDAPQKAVPDGTVPVLQLEPARKSPLPGAASQVAPCARAGVAGSVQAKASADDVSSAARRRRVAAKQSFPVLIRRPNARSRAIDGIHRIGPQGCPDNGPASF